MRKTIKDHNKLYRLLVAISAAVVLILAPVVLISLFKEPSKTLAGWYGDNWPFRTKVTIDHDQVISAQQVINIDHDEGNLDEYTSTVTDGDDLIASHRSAMGGTVYGMSANINDGNQLAANYAQDKSVTFRYRFYVDPNSVTMSDGDEFSLHWVKQHGGSYLGITQVALKYTTASGYQLNFNWYDDGGWAGNDLASITDEPHYVEVKIVWATNSGSSDGSYQWWVDGVDQGAQSNIDNFDRINDYANYWCQLGMIDGRDSGTSGEIYFDEFVANSDSDEIGEGLTDYPVYIDLEHMPNHFHTHVNQTDARDIRVTKADGKTELPREVVSYDSSAKSGQLHFKYSGILSNTKDTDVYIYYGNKTASDYSESATYGAQNVWNSNYVGVWHLEEPDSSLRYDSTSNNNDLIQSDLSLDNDTGVIGLGKEYSISRDLYIDDSSLSSNFPGKSGQTTTSFSASFWYDPTWTEDRDMGKESSSGDGWFFYGSGADDAIFSYYSSTSQLDTQSSVSSIFVIGGYWNYVVGVKNKDKNIDYIYTNGALEGSETGRSGNVDATSAAFRIGGTDVSPADGGYPMDEVRVTNTPLTSTWISTVYNNQYSPSVYYSSAHYDPTFYSIAGYEEKKDQPIAYWKFDEGADNTCSGGVNDACDSTVNGNDAVFTGGVAWQTEDMCISGKCIYLDGSDDAVTASNSAVIDFDENLNDEFTFATWVRVNSDGEASQGEIFDKGTNTYLRITNEGADGYADLEASIDLATTPATLTITNGIVLNQWQHIAVGYTDDGDDEITVYIDGVNRGSSTNGSGAPDTDTNNLLIGGDSSNNFHGFIDEFKIYQNQRTDDEIKTDFVNLASSRGSAASYGPDNSPLSRGLVGYWKMEEASDATRADSSGNGNTLTETTSDTVVQASGKFGSAGDFESGDTEGLYISDASQKGLDITGNISLCAWIKPESLAFGSIVGKMGTPNNSYIMQLEADGDIIFWLSPDGTDGSLVGVETDTGVSASTWSHVCGIYNGTNMQIYVNGSPDGTPTSYSSGIYNGEQDFKIGYPWGNYFDGIIDETRVYNRALTPAEVQGLYNWAPGPVGWWKMDENTGLTAYDSSGNDYNGTISDTTALWQSGKHGSAIKFDGDISEDYINIADNDIFSPITTGAFTVGVWVNMQSYPDDSYFVSKRQAAAEYEWTVRITDTKRLQTHIHTADGGSYMISTAIDITSLVPLNTWHHLAFTFDNSAPSLITYLDGTQVDSVTATSGSMANGTAPVRIGCDGNDNNCSDSIIDDVRIYNYARTSSQIVEDMNAGHPAPGSPVGSAIGHWKFDEGADNTCSGGTNDACNSGSGGSAFDGAESGMAVPATATSGWTNDGKYGKALSFDGSNDFVQISGFLGSPSNITLSGWANLTSADTGGAELISLGDYVVFRLDSYGSLKGIYYDGVDWRETTVSDTFAGEGWHHFTYTIDIDTDTQKLYVDAVERGSSSYTGAIKYSDFGTSNTYIGKHGNSGTTVDFNGKIDEVQIFASALTADQVKLLYNQGAAASMGSLSTDASDNPSWSANDEYCPPGQGSACTPPVAHWKMDEGSWTVDCSTDSVFDSSGNGNHGDACPSSTGPTGGAIGKYGKAGSFDGSNDYINVGNPASGILDFGATDSFVLEAWIKTSSTPSTQANIISKYTGNALYELFMASDGRVALQIRGSNGVGLSTVYSTSYLDDGQWHHVAGVRNVTDDKIYIYVNGVNENSTTDSTTATLAGTGNFFISDRDSVDNYFFPGSLDDVRIYNYARTPAQIAWDMNRGKPVGWWKMDECTGDTLYDSSVSADGSAGGKDGTWSGSGGTNTSSGTCSSGTSTEAWNNGTTGKFNASLDFDGGGASADDMVTITNTSVIDHNEGLFNGFTYSAWIYPESDGEGDAGRIFSKMDGSSNNAVQCNVGNQSGDQLTIRCKLFLGLANDYFTATTTVTTNQWNHVALSWTNDDDDEITIWVNGIPNTSSGLFSGNPTTDSYDIFIGNNFAGSLTFDGKIDDFRIYNYELSAQQIKTVMNESAVDYGPAEGSP
ncbi:DUF2341 domain-containing protein [Patescibacteria group bacterium]